MEKIYQKLKGKEFKTPSYNGVVCGYTDTHILIACLDCSSVMVSFRKFDDKKSVFIEEDYKDSKYRYIYCDERDFKE